MNKLKIGDKIKITKQIVIHTLAHNKSYCDDGGIERPSEVCYKRGSVLTIQDLHVNKFGVWVKEEPYGNFLLVELEK